MRSFRVSCTLRASPAEVWARAATIDGINAELARARAMIRAGALGRSWILPARSAGGLQALVFEAAFRWRHRRLRALWGAA